MERVALREKANELLNQYVLEMESEIGRTGKKLYQVLSQYLDLKAQDPSLTQKLGDLEITDVDQFLPEQVEQYKSTLQQLQKVREKVLQGATSLSEHPWYGIAHPDLKVEEFDFLLRTLRFVSIQLNKLWVEIQSVPLFSNGLDHSSIPEIERIFRWLLSSPNWNELIVQPRVIPALSQLETRRMLLDFTRDVKSARLLREKLEQIEDSKFLDPTLSAGGLELLAEAMGLSEHHKIQNISRKDLENKIKNNEAKTHRLEKIQLFFSNLATQIRFPCPTTVAEAKKVSFAIGLIKTVPTKLLNFRGLKVLDSGIIGRLEKWKEEAAPLVEVKKKLESFFRLEQPFHPEELRNLATELTSGGALRTFTAAHQGAVHRYQSLLKNDVHNSSRKQKRETPAEMAARLVEWATFLDSRRVFDSRVEIRNIFGSLYKGVDTDFSLAIQANGWAGQLRADLRVDSDRFGKALYEALMEAPEGVLKAIFSESLEESFREIEAHLSELDLRADSLFLDNISVQKAEIHELNRLSGVLSRLGIRPDVSLGSLQELKVMTEEIIFLSNRMDANTELKQCLRASYRGIDTDLSIIEQSLIYVQYIETAEIPGNLKTTFISGYGPQRLNESRVLVNSAWSSLESVKESILKLESASLGQTKGLAQLPIPEFLNRIQQALKQPSWIHDWVEYLQCEREVRGTGIGQLLDYQEEKNLFSIPLVKLFEFSFTASLLKKGIGEPSIAEPKLVSPRENSAPLFH